MAKRSHLACELRALLLASTALLPAAALAQAPPPGAAPAGGRVAAGAASIAQTPAQTTINQTSQRAAIDWQGFDVGSQHSVRFNQPSAQSWTLNRVHAPDPSRIAGRIQANGGVAIVNPSGVVFAQGAQVHVGSLIASAANISNENFMAGRMAFDGAPRPGARVENHGEITVAERGMAALVAPGVANSGTIRGRLARVALAGAETYALDLAGDGLLSIEVTQAVRTAPSGATALVTNSGTIDAPGGSVLISAHAASGLLEDLIRQSGRVAADAAAANSAGGSVAIRAEGGGARVTGEVSARGGEAGRGGRVETVASGAVTLERGARVDVSGGAGGGVATVGTTGIGRAQRMAERTVVERGASLRADATARGDGGVIAVNSARQTLVEGALSARGGPGGGDGGFVELSGQHAMRLAAGLDLAAPAGRVGRLLIDPDAIEVVAGAGSTPGTPGPPLAFLASGPAGVLEIGADVLAASSFDIVLDAASTITLKAAVNLGSRELWLFAGDAIAQSAGATITASTLLIRGALGLPSGAGSVALNEANAIARLDAVAIGNISLRNTGALDIATLAGSKLDVATTGALTTTGGVTASAPGSVLRGTSLAIGAAVTAPDLTLTAAAGALTQTAGAVAVSGTLNLFTDAALTQTGGTLAAGTLFRRAADGSAAGGASTLTASGNAIAALDVRSSGATALATGGALTVRQLAAPSADLTVGGTLTVESSGIALSSSGGTARLRADRMDLKAVVSAPGGSIDLAPVTSGRDVVLGAAPGSALSLDATALAQLGEALSPTARLVVAAAGSGEIRLEGDVLLRAAGFTSPRIGELDLAAAAVTQTAGALDVAALRVVATSGAVAVTQAGNAFDSIAGSAAGAFAASTTRALAIGSGGAGASGGDLSLAAPSLGIAENLSVTQANARIVLTSAGTITQSAGVVSAPASGAVELFADGAVTQSGGSLSAGTLRQRGADGSSPGGALAATQPGNALGALDLWSGGPITVAAAARDPASGLSVAQAAGSAVSLTSTAGDLVLGGPVRGATVALAATSAVASEADILTSGGVVTGIPAGIGSAALTTSAVGDTLLGASGNRIASASVTGGVAGARRDVLVTSALDLAVEGVARDVVLSAPALQIASGGLTAAGQLVVEAGSGALTQGGPLSVAGAFSGRVAREIVLDDAGNAIATLGAAGAPLRAGTAATSAAEARLVLRDGEGGLAIAGEVSVGVDTAGAAIPAARGALLALRTDTLDIGNLVSAPGGTLDIAPTSAGRAVTLGAEAPGQLSLSTAELRFLGLGGAAVATLRVTAPAVTFAGDVPLQDPGGAPARVAALDLRSAAVGQTAGGLRVGDLRLRGEDGAAPIATASLPGGNAIGRLDAAAAGALAVNNAAALEVLAASGATVSLGAAGPLTLSGPVSAAASLSARGAGIATAAPLVTTAAGSTITLTSPRGGIALGADVSTPPGGTLRLHADGATSQSAGAVTTGTLVHRGASGAAAGGGLALNRPGNAIAALDARGGTIEVFTSGDLAVQQADARFFDVRLEAGGALAVTGLAQGRNVTLRAGAGGIALTGGIGAGFAATLATPGAIVLNDAPISVAQSLRLHSDGAVTQAAGGRVEASRVIRRDAAGTAAGGALGLGAPANAITRLDVLGTGAVTVRSAAAMTVEAASGTAIDLRVGDPGLGQLLWVAGRVTASAGDIVLQGRTVLLESDVTAGAGRNIRLAATRGGLEHAAGAIVTGPDGSVVFEAPQAVTLSGGAITTGALAFRTDRQLQQSGGTLAATALRIGGLTGAAAGAADLRQPGNVLGSLDGATRGALLLRGSSALDIVRAEGSEVAVATEGALRVLGPATGGATGVRLYGGGIELAADVRSLGPAGGIALVTPGAITQFAGALDAAGGLLLLAADGATTQLSGSVRAGRVLHLGGDEASPGGALSLGGGANAVAALSSDSRGAVLLRTSGDHEALALRGSTIDVAASGAVNLRGPVLATGAARFAAGRALIFEAGASVSAASLEALAGPASPLLTRGVAMTIGSVALLAGDGITANGLVLRPRTPGVLPLLLLDTRGAAARLAGIPGALLASPDRPGVPAALQRVQIRRPDRPAAVDFGASSAAPGGMAVFDVDAGASPLFLLLDAGSARGSLVAGRLGVHGRDGALDITGTLSGIGGAGTAQLADITRTGEAGLLLGGGIASYRINDCVISSVNCVSPTVIVLLTPAAPAPVVIVREEAPRDPDTLVPNAGAEEE